MKAIKIPFQFNGGKTATTSSMSVATEQKIVNVLVTQKYERVMRHKYGFGIQTLLFDVIDEIELTDHIVEAKSDIQAAVSDVSILDVKLAPTNSIAAFGSPETTLGITVVYKLPLGSPQLVKFDVVSPTNLTEDSFI
jgi:hypothetical protein